MRLHIDTLLGNPKGAARLPSPATDEDQKAWKIDADVDNFDPCPRSPEASPSNSDTSFPGSNGPQHPKATPQQLIVMQTIMQFVGVSRFRPNFAKSPSSAENKWLWDLAFSIFIKLVECGEYPGVSLEASNQKYLKKLLNTRVRSLMKRSVVFPLSTSGAPTSSNEDVNLNSVTMSFRYQEENWAETRKKRAASAMRRRARLSHVGPVFYICFPTSFSN